MIGSQNPFSLVRYPFTFLRSPKLKKVLYLTASTLFLDSQAQPWAAPWNPGRASRLFLNLYSLCVSGYSTWSPKVLVLATSFWLLETVQFWCALLALLHPWWVGDPVQSIQMVKSDAINSDGQIRCKAIEHGETNHYFHTHLQSNIIVKVLSIGEGMLTRPCPNLRDVVSRI
jgi:hypothetical protein